MPFSREQLRNPQQRLERLMGSELDATKTISSLTLFEAAGRRRSSTFRSVEAWMWEHRQHLSEGTKKTHVRKTTQVSVSRLRQHLPSYPKRVQAGEAIQITSRGHVIARLGAEQVPALEARRWLESLKSKVELVDVLSPLGTSSADATWSGDADHL